MKKDEKNFTQEELNEQSSTNAETQVGGCLIGMHRRS